MSAATESDNAGSASELSGVTDDLTQDQTASRKLVGLAKRFGQYLSEGPERFRSRLGFRNPVPRPSDRFELTSLRARYRTDHEPYVRYLVRALRMRGDVAPRNIALSAGYGMGKSSVLQGVARAFPRRVVEITFGALQHGIGESSASKTVEKAHIRDEIRTVQQEVVKQLLYSARPSRVPGSRFRRLDRLRASSVAAMVIPTIAVLLAIVFAGRFAERFEEIAIDGGWPLWAGYTTAFLILAGGSWLIVLRIGAEIRVGKVSAGSTSIELVGAEGNGDFFDRYLDEIVYFFQRTKRDIVVFEDIDRFGNAAVFEELRELNAILNRAEQISRKPIRFVYSVRDSLFDEWPSDAESKLPIGLRRAAQRTKFFDLVVPMVPSITHRTARDVMANFREGLGGEGVADDLVQEVSRAVPDMRVMQGILNEFKVFRTITTGQNRPALEADASFALVVYKTLEPADFELLQFNESNLDGLFKSARDLVVAQTESVRTALSEWDAVAEAGATEEHLAKAAGNRVNRQLARYLKFARITGELTWSVNGAAESPGALKTPDFWRKLLADDAAEVRVVGTVNSRAWTLTATDLLDIAAVSPSTWGATSVEQAIQRNLALREEERTLPRTSWQELYARSDVRSSAGSFREQVEALFPNSVVPRLIELGYLTEDFHLYASVFHGRYVGRRATTFIHRYVHQRERAPEFSFGSELEVEAMLDDLGASFLTESSALNLDIANFLLSKGTESEFFARYGDPDEDAQTFAALYIRAGADPTEFIRRVSPLWAEVFNFLIEPELKSRADPPSLLEAALAAASLRTAYVVSDENLGRFAQVIAQLPIMKRALPRPYVAKIAAVLARLNVDVSDLSELSDNLREEVIQTGRFAIDHQNLLLAGSGSVSLNSLAKHDAVFRRVVSNLAAYADLIERHDAVAISDPAQFTAVVTRLGDVEPDALQRVLSRAHEESSVASLRDLPSSTWIPLIRSHRAAPTVDSISVYMDSHGVDIDLVDYLSRVKSIDTGGTEEPDKIALSLQLIGAVELPATERARLVETISLDNALPVASIVIDSADLVEELVKRVIVADDSLTFEWAKAAGTDYFVSYLRASSQFAEFISKATLSPQELERIFDPSSTLPDLVRRAVHDNIELFEANMIRGTSLRYGHWLAGAGVVLSEPDIAKRVGHGIRLDDALDLLLLGAAGRDSGELTRLVGMMGKRYSRLLTVGMGSETFVASERHTVLIQLLQMRGLIASWRTTKTGKLQAYRRQK